MDKVIQKIFGWKQMAGHKVFQRYFKKFGQADNQRIFTELFNWFFKQIKFDNFKLDLYSTLTLPAKAVWDLYRNRADAENRIKELKEDFGADSFNVEDFFDTEAALNFVMMG